MHGMGPRFNVMTGLRPTAKLRPLLQRSAQRRLTPAPSKDWNPSNDWDSTPRPASATVSIAVNLPEDAVLHTQAAVGSTLMEALEAADLSDVWIGGACGGLCQCSTCRVIVETVAAPFPEREEEEEDMLDTAVTAALRSNDLDKQAAEQMEESYLMPSSRLACQLTVRPEDDGLVITLPDDVLNVLEVPLWLRGSR